MKKRNIIIATDGKQTMIFSNGKLYGDYISEVTFRHKAKEDVSLEVTALDLPVEGKEDLTGFEQYLKDMLNATSSVDGVDKLLD